MSNNKVVKFKKRKSINIGIIVFFIMAVYISINVYIYFTKEQLSIYEVQEGTTAIDNRITGLILRDERVIFSQEAGYISYYQKEGARVAKNSTIYSVDDTGQMLEVIANGDVPITLSKQNNSELKHDIEAFYHVFNDNNFSAVYDFKEETQSRVLDILNTTMISHSQKLLEETGIAYSYQMYRSEESGVISYYIDNYESVTPETVTAEMFQIENYSKQGLRTTDMIAQNTPVYKLIKSEEWNIVLPLTEEQYEKLSGKDTVSFTILEDDLDLSGKLNLYQKGSEYYANISLSKHMINYLNERFIDIELDFDTVEGLKIPLTSIVEKNFYLVPLEYFTMGGDSTEQGLIKIEYDKNGEISYPFVPTEIYYQDTAYAYVDADLFEPGTKILSPVGPEQYTLSQMNKLTGVYNVNLGYSVFKRIEILYQNKEYCIISNNTPNGISAYDHIALDGKAVIEEKIIY